MAINRRCDTSATGTATTFSVALTGWTNAGAGVSGTAPAVGDVVFVVGGVNSANRVFTQTAGAGAWVIRSSDNNSGTAAFTSFVAYRVFDGTETSPTFDWGLTSHAYAWVAMAVTPDSPFTPGADAWATVKVDTSGLTSHTPNAATATTGYTDYDLLLAWAATTTNGTSAVAFTAPTNWALDAAASCSNTGTSSTKGYGAAIAARASQTGTVTPGAWTIEGGSSGTSTTTANLYHVVIREDLVLGEPGSRPGPAWRNRFQRGYGQALAVAGALDSTTAAATPVPLAETGTAADSLVVGVEPGAAVQAYPGPAWTAFFQPWRPRPAVQGATDNSQAAISVAETGAAADALTVAAAVPLADTGASLEAISAAGAISLAEAGAGSDALTVGVEPGAAVQAYPGPAWTAFFQPWRPRPAVQGATDNSQAAIYLADAGTAADAVTVAAAVPLAEAGTGSDALTVAVAVPLAEAGTGSETVSVAATVPLAETGTGSDALTVGVEPGAVQQVYPGPAWLGFFQPWRGRPAVGGAYDTSGTTTTAAALPETGTAADTISVAAAVPLADTGTGSDALTLSAAVPLAETGAGADVLTVAAAITLAETGAAADALTVAVAVPLAETGASAEALSLAVAVPLADLATAADALALSILVNDAPTTVQPGPAWRNHFQPWRGPLQVQGAMEAPPPVGRPGTVTLTDLPTATATVADLLAMTATLSDSAVGAATVADLLTMTATLSDSAVYAVTIGDTQP